MLDGDRFIVNGQKVWTSGAHDADLLLAFVRTDPDVPKHKGISALIIETDSPGLVRRPFGDITGRSPDFNEVFFDDVEVPAENLVGDAQRRLASLHRLTGPTSARCSGSSGPRASTGCSTTCLSK